MAKKIKYRFAGNDDLDYQFRVTASILDRKFQRGVVPEIKTIGVIEPITLLSKYYLSFMFTIDSARTDSAYKAIGSGSDDQIERLKARKKKKNYIDVIHGDFSFKVIREDMNGAPMLKVNDEFSYYDFEILVNTYTSAFVVKTKGFDEVLEIPFNYTGPRALFQFLEVLTMSHFIDDLLTRKHLRLKRDFIERGLRPEIDLYSELEEFMNETSLDPTEVSLE